MLMIKMCRLAGLLQFSPSRQFAGLKDLLGMLCLALAGASFSSHVVAQAQGTPLAFGKARPALSTGSPTADPTANAKVVPVAPVPAAAASAQVAVSAPPLGTEAAKSAVLPAAVGVGATFPAAWEGVVRIEASTLTPDYRSPWNAGRPGGGTGTGWLIGKNKFVTNAHVVAHASRLLIRLPNDPRPFEARVVHVAHDSDLAMIEALNPTPFENLPPLKLGGLPALNTEVVAIGYPVGGERLSVTRGVVSRIDFRSYAHTGIDAHLTVQIDAAINPGNSGGPVIQDGKVVGVAFQGINGAAAQNVAYMIPVPVIQRFITDIQDGKYDHYVDLAISHFPIENAAQRKALGLKDDGMGVYVSLVHSTGSAAGKVMVGDVLLSIDGAPVFSNGLISVQGELVDLNEVVERKFATDKVVLGLLREGKEITTELQLKRFSAMLPLGAQYEARPRYVLYAGLLFQPMSRDLMVAHGIKDAVVNYYFKEFLDRELYKERPEVVVLTSILPDQVNSYLAAYRHSVVDEINGDVIKSLADVPRALAKQGLKPGFVEIRLQDVSRSLVLNRDLADQSLPRIMSKYGVSQPQYLGE
jgi:S1-C subfamily serine protease